MHQPLWPALVLLIFACGMFLLAYLGLRTGISRGRFGRIAMRAEAPVTFWIHISALSIGATFLLALACYIAYLNLNGLKAFWDWPDLIR